MPRLMLPSLHRMRRDLLILLVAVAAAFEHDAVELAEPSFENIERHLIALRLAPALAALVLAATLTALAFAATFTLCHRILSEG